MRSVTVILLLTLVRTTAAADPQKPARTCKPSGGVLFEVAQRAKRPAVVPTATTRLYANGAWRLAVIDVDGKFARTDSGCLEPSQVKSIRESLRAAPWKTTRSDQTCRADQPRFTTYTWKRRLLYTERTCNERVLDAESQRALDLVTYYLNPPVDHGGRIDCLRTRSPRVATSVYEAFAGTRIRARDDDSSTRNECARAPARTLASRL